MISAKNHKFICLLSAVLAATVLCSCGKVQNIKTPSGKIAVKAGDYSFTDDFYNYFYQNYISQDGCDEQTAKSNAEGDIRHYAAVLTLAEEYNVELTDDEVQKAEDALQSGIDYYGEDEFEEQLKSYNMTQDLYVYLTELQTLETDLRSYMIDETSFDEDGNPIIDSSDSVVNEDITSNFYAAKQIFIKNDEGDSTENNEALINQIYTELQNGADFDTLISEYSEDDEKGIRAFTDGMMVEEYEDAVKDLSVGDVSGVVKSSVGFHIIKRVELTSDYIDENFDDLRFDYQNKEFNEILSDTASSLEVIWKN